MRSDAAVYLSFTAVWKLPAARRRHEDMSRSFLLQSVHSILTFSIDHIQNKHAVQYGPEAVLKASIDVDQGARHGEYSDLEAEDCN